MEKSSRRRPARQIAGSGAPAGTTTTPATGVGRIAIDPNNKNVAYLCFNGYGTPASPIAHVWKTTNLSAATVTFVPASVGLPDIPVNAIAIDAVTGDSCGGADVYVGTDAGVYYSADGGISWRAYGNGFPHVAVFGLESQSRSRVIRAATHGRGLYQTATVSTILPTPTPSPTPSPPYGTIQSPTVCEVLSGSTVTFTWTQGQVTAFWLTVGSTPGASDIFSSGQTAGAQNSDGLRSYTVSNLPTDGRNLYVRLYSYVGGAWYDPPQDYVFIAFRGIVQAPVIAPSSGTFKKKVTVNIATATPGATIYYTTDGSVPTTSSPQFKAPFTLVGKRTVTIKAKAVKNGVPDSPVVSATLTIK